MKPHDKIKHTNWFTDIYDMQFTVNCVNTEKMLKKLTYSLRLMLNLMDKAAQFL